MHSNDLEACGMKLCCFWFHSDVKFLMRSLYSGERQWHTWASCFMYWSFHYGMACRPHISLLYIAYLYIIYYYVLGLVLESRKKKFIREKIF